MYGPISGYFCSWGSLFNNLFGKLCTYYISFSSHIKMHFTKTMLSSSSCNILDMMLGRKRGLLNNIHLIAPGNLDSILWNVWINEWSYVTLRAKVSGIASSRGTLPPGTSVHIHRRDGRGGDLIQDATNVTGHIHESLFIHQNEGMFLEERYSEL